MRETCYWEWEMRMNIWFLFNGDSTIHTIGCIRSLLSTLSILRSKMKNANINFSFCMDNHNEAPEKEWWCGKKAEGVMTRARVRMSWKKMRLENVRMRME